ncbi:MAG: helix-turn-helix transcriptional regulator [Flavobacteriales bacterium]
MHETSPARGQVALRSNKLLTLRLERHMTQQYVADSLGVDASTLSRWEKDDDKICIGKLRQIAEFYHVEMEWLLSSDHGSLPMHGTKVVKVANNVHNNMNGVSEELLERLSAQYSAHIEILQKLTDRLIDLLDERPDRSRQ